MLEKLHQRRELLERERPVTALVQQHRSLVTDVGGEEQVLVAAHEERRRAKRLLCLGEPAQRARDGPLQDGDEDGRLIGEGGPDLEGDGAADRLAGLEIPRLHPEHVGQVKPERGGPRRVRASLRLASQQLLGHPGAACERGDERLDGQATHPDVLGQVRILP